MPKRVALVTRVPKDGLGKAGAVRVASWCTFGCTTLSVNLLGARGAEFPYRLAPIKAVKAFQLEESLNGFPWSPACLRPALVERERCGRLADALLGPRGPLCRAVARLTGP